jgi:hypothetical protein
VKIREKGKSTRKTSKKIRVEESSMKGRECKIYQRHKEQK